MASLDASQSPDTKNLLLDAENNLDDYDIAITHDSNIELKGRNMVKSFFHNVRKYKSLSDSETRRWLENLPFHMRKDAIPLFVDGNSEDNSIEYQLHPSYTFLEPIKAATRPHTQFFRLYTNDHLLESPDLVMGIGRLFANYRNGDERRTSKWTGYEVFVDQTLALWMVFDTRSINPRALDWYPQPCRLSLLISSDSDETGKDPRDVSEERRYDIACFLPSLCDLPNFEFERAWKTVQKTGKSGKMTIGLVDKSEAEKRLSKYPILDNSDQSKAERQLLKHPTLDISQKVLDDLRKAILIAVNDDKTGGRALITLIARYGGNPSLIKKVITPKVIFVAVRNELFGEEIVSILVKAFPDEVCDSLSTRSVEAAAGNGTYGRQIMEKFLVTFGKLFWESMSPAAVYTAITNERCGSQILTLLFDNDRQRRGLMEGRRGHGIGTDLQGTY
ncbi:MAG: hypothetical protein M1814_000941 [Vezdaea aestivalis]|nr:MAG: hypothetical protein M1814_000941 [Vezdaea aestivalis]